MSIKEELAELSRLSGPYRTTDPIKAAAWEAAGFAPPGTTYISPEELPTDVPDLNETAAQHGIVQPSPEEVRRVAAELSALTRK